MAKTTIRVRKKRWDFFNRECKVMSLRRDDLLNRLLPAEIKLMGKIPACDAVGAQWLKQHWTTMWVGDLELINAPVMLSSEVIGQLKTTCAQKGVPRDAFFDCFLWYLTTRFHDPALVIKNPRTNSDLGSQVAAIIMDEDIKPRDTERFLMDVSADWIKGRSLATWDQDFYSKQLSYDAARVEEQKTLLEAFAIAL